MAIAISCTLIDDDTGERLDFKRMHLADRFLGRSAGYIRTCDYKGLKACHSKTGKTYSYEFSQPFYVATGTYTANKEQTLCWECKKSIGHCNWSRYLKPVPGWTATSTTIRYSNTCDESYCVVACPEYEPG